VDAGREGLMLALQGYRACCSQQAAASHWTAVYNRSMIRDGLWAEARAGRAVGFDGKTLMPSSAANRTTNRAFAPDAPRRLTTRGALWSKRLTVEPSGFRGRSDRSDARSGCAPPALGDRVMSISPTVFGTGSLPFVTRRRYPRCYEPGLHLARLLRSAR